MRRGENRTDNRDTGMKLKYFGSWWYIGAAMVAYVYFMRVVFSFQTVDPAAVYLSGPACAIAGTQHVSGEVCKLEGSLSQSVNGTRWLTPAGQPQQRVQLPDNVSIVHGRGAEHFPGGDTAMGALLIAAWVLLFAPMVVALVQQVADCLQRWQALRAPHDPAPDNRTGGSAR